MPKTSLLKANLRVHDPISVSKIDSAISLALADGVAMPGIEDASARSTLCMQIIESIRRVQFVRRIGYRTINPLRLDPASDLFDPLRAASLLKDAGDIDEAAWLVFLATHFGHRPTSKWSLVKIFYSGGNNNRLSWSYSLNNTSDLLLWLDKNKERIRAAGRFGNHRKYESLEAYGTNGTGAAVTSYINWVASYGGHRKLFERANKEGGGIPELAFAWLYDDMKNVVRFGRMGKFDFLCMLGKLDITYINPGSMFVAQATGPLRGARVLFGADKTAKEIEASVQHLDERMLVGMQVFEDAICNWQKSTHEFIAFRG